MGAKSSTLRYSELQDRVHGLNPEHIQELLSDGEMRHYLIKNVNLQKGFLNLIAPILDKSEKDVIFHRSGSDADRMNVILEVIKRNGPYSFRIFIKALQETKQESVLHHLEKGCLRLFKESKIEEVFQRSLKEGQTEACRGRIVLLGRAGVGKTSVKNALLGKEYPKDHEVTDMVDISFATVDDRGEWKSIDDKERKTHDEYYLVAKVMEKHPELQNMTDKFESVGESAPETSYKEDVREETVGGAAGGPTSTPGIDVVTVQPKGKRKVDVPEEVRSLLEQGKNMAKNHMFQIWDFAGQLVYYTVHQLFITEKTVFILVLDASRDLDAPVDPRYAEYHDERFDSECSPKTEKEFLEYFLRSVNVWANLQKESALLQGPCQPPHVFILCNKGDLLTAEAMDLYVESVKKLVQGTPAFRAMVRNVIPFVSNPQGEVKVEVKEEEVNTEVRSGWGFTELLRHAAQSLLGTATTSPYEESCKDLKINLRRVIGDFLQKIPIKWFNFRNALQEKCHRSFEDVVEVAKSQDIATEEVDAMLQYFHMNRELIFWDTEERGKFIISQPSWLISEMRKVITIEKNQSYDWIESAEIGRFLDTLRMEQVLYERLAKELWTDHHKSLIDILEKYFLLLPWTDDECGRRRYKVPCMLKSMDETERGYARNGIPPLYLYMADTVMPIGLTSRLVTLLATERGWTDGKHEPEIYFNGATFIRKEANVYAIIRIEETVWRPPSDSKEREQLVIKVHAEPASRMTGVKIEKFAACLNKVRQTIEKGLERILETINVSQDVVVAAENECGHELQNLSYKKESWDCCSSCRKESRNGDQQWWFGEITDWDTKNQLMDSQDDDDSDLEDLPTGQNIFGHYLGGYGEDEGECEEWSQESQKWKRKSRREQEKIITDHLGVAEANMMEFMEIDHVFIANLNQHKILDLHTRETLKMDTLTNSQKIAILSHHVRCCPITRTKALLTSLAATEQSRVVQEFDTKKIRACLGYPINRASLYRIIKAQIKRKLTNR